MTRAQADLEVRRDVVIPASELRETASRSSGPGGQHVNKSNTRVTLRWNLEQSVAVGSVRRDRLRRRLRKRLTLSGDILVHVGRHRSRARNRELARERLAELIREALTAPRRRKATRPSKAARARGAEAKRRSSARKQLRRRVDPGSS
ncbi:MAG: alternative ribosome rescue aminoacyl-tRNA hydrolase ArfB [Myxococcota bacterium]